MPTDVEISISLDGITYKPFTIRNDISEKSEEPQVKQFKTSFNESDVEFIHIKAHNIGMCPPWHAGAGGNAWMFTDEIVIQ